MGGRRRRSSKTRKTRKMYGGNFYGFTTDAGLGSAGAARPAVENVAANPVTGGLIPNDGSELNAPKLGGRRRRRKGTKKMTKKKGGKRRGRKTMRGGASYVSSAGVGASFRGEGVAGLGNYSAYGAKMPVAGGPTQGGDGVYQTS